ncbi:MAG: siroheme decarboxylase subunit alpha [Phycisphaerae bacterium]
MLKLEPADTKLLDVVQTGIPLVERPFRAIGEQAGMSESEVIQRLRVMRHPPAGERGIIRQMSAIFDSKSLGYQTTLVAAKVADSRLEAAAEVINRHPGVSHNYRRNHEFNLWYTVAVPSDSELGLEKTVAILHGESGAVSTRMLPTLKLFKIGVKFDLSGEGDIAGRSDTKLYGRGSCDRVISEGEKGIVRVLQEDLPLVEEPFKEWAGVAGVSERSLLEAAQWFVDSGLMRRFAAVLKHREAGISANGMGVWVVPEAQVESFGKLAAGFGAVSHCYLRATYPDWPYSVFTMVHAPTREGCEAVLGRIAAESGVGTYAILYSTREYKKVRVRYFTPEIGEWERGRG